MSLYKLRYSTRVLHRLVREECEERSWTEDDRDRPKKREGHGDINCYSSCLNQINQSHNDKRGGYFSDLSALKVAVLVSCYMIICDHTCTYVSIFVIKCGRFNDLGESVMCDRNGLLSL